MEYHSGRTISRVHSPATPENPAQQPVTPGLNTQNSAAAAHGFECREGPLGRFEFPMRKFHNNLSSAAEPILAV